LDYQVDLAAKVTGHDTDGYRNKGGKDRAGYADNHGDAGPVDNAAQYVAPQIVSAKRELSRRGREVLSHAGIIHAVGSNEVGKDTGEQQKQGNHRTHGA